MLMTTTPGVEGRPAKAILGIVTGEAVSLRTLEDLGATFQNIGQGTSRPSGSLASGPRASALDSSASGPTRVKPVRVRGTAALERLRPEASHRRRTITSGAPR